MALFKFRSSGSAAAPEAPVNPAKTESVETLRRRARHRLIGAAILVLAGIIGLPLVLDTQPRSVDVDIPIIIPERHKAKPLALPEKPAKVTAAPAAPAVLPGAAPSAAGDGAPVTVMDATAPGEEIVATRPAAATTPKAVSINKKTQDNAVDTAGGAIKNEATKAPPATTSTSAKPVPAKPAAAPPVLVKPVEKPKTEKPAASPQPQATGQRYVVQAGAFAEVTKAREVRLKIERAGITTYTQVVQTPEGRRIRVRAGPFNTQAEVDKVAAKIRALGLTASVLTL